MLITIDTDILIKNKLNANQFVVLKLIHEREIDILRKYLRENDKLDEFTNDISKLSDMGYLLSYRKEAYDFNNLKTGSKFVELISGGDLFEELIQNYPKSVVRPEGNIDYLITDLSKAKAMYIKLVHNNKALHEHIINCLREEVDDKEENDNMMFMKRLPRWISDRNWESYKEQVRDLQSVSGNSLTGYGVKVE